MNWFNNLRLSGKLLASFTVVLVITSALGILAIVRLGNLAAQTSQLAEVNMPSLDLLGSINTIASDVRISQIRHVVADTPDEQTQIDRAELGVALQGRLAHHRCTVAERGRRKRLSTRQSSHKPEVG